MRRAVRFFFLLLFVFSFSLLNSSAGIVDTKSAVKAENSEHRAQANAQLQLARQLMSARDYQSAADILESLYEIDPTNSIISNSLKSCYEQLKQYSKGELLLRRLSEQFPDNISYKINLAENLIYQGKLDEGKKLYNNLLDKFEPNNAVMYTNVVRSMISCKLEDEAALTIEKLRQQSGNLTLMAVENAEILQLKRKYNDAALEYFSVLTDTTRTGNTAEKSLQELLGFVESSAPTEKALLSKITIDSSGRALKLLSSYYLRTGRYEDAYQFAIRQDSATGLGGTGLIQYLRGCMEQKLYTQSVRICEYVINNLSDKPYVNEFYYRYAESLEELGQYERSIKVYDTILTILPREQDKAEAAYRIGKIHLDRLNAPQTALIYFDSVMNHYPLGFAYNAARLANPRAHMQMGNLNESRKEYEKQSAIRQNPEISEEIQFNLALLDLFEHKYDSCDKALKKLLVDYPQGFYINDAVQLSFLMSQAGEATELLDDFADAVLFEKMKMPDSTVSRLLSIADAPNKVLADVALFRISEARLSRGDSTATIKYIERMEAEFGDSYYLPYGLKTKADILLTKKESIESAKEIYRRLLEDYPNYPFINEVREKLRELESVPKPS